MIRARHNDFISWKSPEGFRDEPIGKGKYGTVYSSNDNKTALKQIKLKKEGKTAKQRESISRMGRQLARESLICEALTMMCVTGACLHFPYAYSYVKTDDGPTVTANIFMEKFDGCLSDISRPLLRSEKQWYSLLHQIANALWCASKAFSIVHCDLYPKNVLFLRGKPQGFRYNTFHDVTVEASALYVLSDFGICSSPCFDATDRPEVSRSIQVECTPRLSDLVLEKHILYYDVPAFKRDYFLLLSWAAHAERFGLPRAPKAVKARALDCIARLHDCRNDDDLDIVLKDFFEEMDQTVPPQIETMADKEKISVARNKFENIVGG